jgi:hypothetical protein
MSRVVKVEKREARRTTEATRTQYSGLRLRGIGLELKNEENVKCENWKRHTRRSRNEG